MDAALSRDIEDFVRGQVAPTDAARHGLVIGIESYRDARLNLRCARNDALALHRLMIAPDCGCFPESNVTLLLDAEATRENVWKALAALRKRVSENDTVWIFYAGHAAPEGARHFWVTHDADVDDLYATGLDGEQIAQVLNDIPSSRLLVLLDCCHAAALAKRRNPTRSAPTAGELLGRYAGKGRLTLSSSDGQEKSVELADKGHGAFTYFLEQGLRGEADQDGDGVVTAGELWAYLRARVSDASRQAGVPQTPVLLGEMTHDWALTVNPAAVAQKRRLADAIQARIGLARDQLSTDEAAACMDLLRRGPRTPEEQTVWTELGNLAEGRLRGETFKQLVQAVVRAAPAVTPKPGTGGLASPEPRPVGSRSRPGGEGGWYENEAGQVVIRAVRPRG